MVVRPPSDRQVNRAPPMFSRLIQNGASRRHRPDCRRFDLPERLRRRAHNRCDRTGSHGHHGREMRKVHTRVMAIAGASQNWSGRCRSTAMISSCSTEDASDRRLCDGCLRKPPPTDGANPANGSGSKNSPNRGPTPFQRRYRRRQFSDRFVDRYARANRRNQVAWRPRR
jgi:hypothetical protein